MGITNLTNMGFRKPSLSRLATLAALLAFTVSSSLAHRSEPRTFSSPEEASRALFRALQNEDEPVLELILGAGKELTSSSDEVEDQLEREQFRKKYVEMHRLVREPDGSAVLYIGAENWPFPIPLVPKDGRWFFDSDTGMQEVQFRRVGENETTAIQVCSDFVLGRKQQNADPSSHDASKQYALNLVSAGANTQGATSSEPASHPAPFHGYYFRPVIRSAPVKKANAVALIAYPAEYRSTGVMTFIVTENGGVYEKDLGPKTEELSKTITVRKTGSKWRATQSAEVASQR
jgi:hypothetical protein